jgi:surface antigen
MTGQWRSIMAAFALVATFLVSVPATATGYLQCVPFARAESGVQLFGNARDWWSMADGRYDRGQQPRVGAVMAFAPTSAMPIGHVAVVSQIVGERELRISHANWSPINGRRGQIERNVRVIDVSAAGDWSAVRVWYAPIGDLGLRVNPIRGFIYPGEGASPAMNRPSPRDIAMATPDADGALAAIVRSVGR